MSKTILIVEDEIDLLLNNCEFFELLGFRVLAAETLAQAREAMALLPPDIILLDINMPDGSGFSFIRELKRPLDIPVIFLTGRDGREDILKGFSLGGVDYVTKPYDLDVLAARVNAALRRAPEAQAAEEGPLRLDIPRQAAYLNGRDIRLTQKEFALLYLLFCEKGRVVASGRLYEAVWGAPLSGNAGALWKQLSNLKRKLEPGDGAVALSSIRGEGYMLEIRD